MDREEEYKIAREFFIEGFFEGVDQGVGNFELDKPINKFKEKWEELRG